MHSNFDSFDINNLKINTAVVSVKYFNMSKFVDTLIEARDIEYTVRDKRSSNLAIRLALEHIAESLLDSFPNKQMAQYIIDDKTRNKYLDGHFNLSFSLHIMKAIKHNGIIKDKKVIDDMYELYKATSGSASTHTNTANKSSNKNKDIDDKFVSYEDTFKNLQMLYNIIKRLTLSSAPTFSVERIPINNYIVSQRLHKSQFGNESRIYIGEDSNKSKAVIFEYKGEYQESGQYIVKSDDNKSKSLAKEEKIKVGSIVANKSRDEFTQILKPTIVNKEKRYGGYYYAIYPLADCDVSLSEELEEWKEDMIHNLYRGLTIGSHVIKTLVRLKENGINHRNICPENIFINSTDWYARLTNYTMIKLDDRLAKSMSETKTLAITDYGIEYFTKNPYMPKGMSEFFFKGSESIEQNKEALKNVNWELLDTFAAVKIVSECFCFKKPAEALNKKLVPSAAKLFEAWAKVSEYPSDRFNKSNAAEADLDLDTAEFLIKKAIKECENRG